MTLPVLRNRVQVPGTTSTSYPAKITEFNVCFLMYCFTVNIVRFWFLIHYDLSTNVANGKRGNQFQNGDWWRPWYPVGGGMKCSCCKEAQSIVHLVMMDGSKRSLSLLIYHNSIIEINPKIGRRLAFAACWRRAYVYPNCSLKNDSIMFGHDRHLTSDTKTTKTTSLHQEQQRPYWCSLSNSVVGSIPYMLKY